MRQGLYTPLHTNKRRSIWRYVGGIVGTLVVLLLIVFNHMIFAGFSGLVSYVLDDRTQEYALIPRSVLEARLKDTEEELARVKYQGLLYTLEVEKNAALIDSFGVPENNVVARGRVFAQPPQTHYDTLLVAIEEGASVSVGDHTYVSGILVGEVVERAHSTVRVALFSSPGNTFDVRLGSPSAITIIRGLGAGAFTFEVSKEVEVTAGEPVLLAQSEALVAVVQSVVNEDERTTFTVYASSPVATADMRVVEFVKPFLQETDLDEEL